MSLAKAADIIVEPISVSLFFVKSGKQSGPSKSCPMNAIKDASQASYLAKTDLAMKVVLHAYLISKT